MTVDDVLDNYLLDLLDLLAHLDILDLLDLLAHLGILDLLDLLSREQIGDLVLNESSLLT